MDTPLIHPSTNIIVSYLLKALPQSLLISGEDGIGLSTVGEYIANHHSRFVQVVLPEKDEKVDLEKGNIGVESIRKLASSTRTKHTDKQVILIDYAERMSLQAQNAFLKLLEEPGESVYFILATHSPSLLLPTIRSRVQSVELKKITTQQTNTLLDHLGIVDERQRLQLLFIAAGLPAELTRLAHDKTYFDERTKIVRDARELLGPSIYSRMKVANNYKDDRVKSLLLLSDAASILKRSMAQSPQPTALLTIEKILKAYERIEGNGNIRLCLNRLVL